MIMESPEQIRKRKRLTKAAYYYYLSPFRHFPSVRSLLFAFSFITFLYLFSHRISFLNTSPFHPVLVVSTLSILSSSSDVANHSKFNQLFVFNVEDRVLFPDHVLLLVSNRNGNGSGNRNRNGNGNGIRETELECVYGGANSTGAGGDVIPVKRDVISLDEYSEDRLIVRCPLPPANCSPAVTLHRRGKFVINLVEENGLLRSNQAVSSWENVAYEAALDGNTVVVFVKGLSHRPDRESDPNHFSCQFGLGNLERDRNYALSTRAVTVAQEVVRCLLPKSIAKNPEKARGVRVTVRLTSQHVHSKIRNHIVVPSVAKISGASKEEGKKGMEIRRKHSVCVCTMVWNQAYSLREWVMYHAWLGVEKWFIYDNNSDDEIKQVIEDLELGNYNVSRHVWPWIKTQEAGFSHCALRAREECDWVSFMDVDEFFYFPYPSFQDRKTNHLGFPGHNSVRKLVSNFSLSSNIGEIRTSCHSFGPSGLSSLPPQGATVGYTCRLQSPERHKSIIRPDALDPTLLNVVHHFHLKKGFRYINLSQKTAVINHYKYQVWEAFRAKFKRRVATYVADWQDSTNEGSRDRAPGLGTEAIEPPNWRLQFCEVWDTGLKDFILANLADPVTRLLPWEISSI